MVRQGGIQMPSFSDALTQEQIDAVAQYTAASVADPASHEAELNRGGDLYRLYCAGCHSATGRGGALTSGQNAPNIAQYPAAEALAAMILGRGQMPAFAGNTFDVTQQTSVALYVDHLIPPASPGGAGLWYLGPVPEGLFGALGLVILVVLAVWLAWKSRKAVP
jgi:ubiquinol-cytochrome c reductase cytochrome c subunit